MSLFSVNIKNTHQFFNLLKEDYLYSSAKELINIYIKKYNPHIVYDSSFKADFPSEKNFNQRFWELYLYFMFCDEDFIIDSDITVPDFSISKNGINIIVEARTLNSPQDYSGISNYINNPDLFVNRIKNSLKKKLKKNYAKNNFSIAFADFRSEVYVEDEKLIPRSADVSYPKLVEALYGKYKNNISYLEFNNQQDAFFNEKGADKVDAIFYSRSGTIPKLNRIGKAWGLGDKNYYIKSFQTYCNKSPKAIQANLL